MDSKPFEQTEREAREQAEKRSWQLLSERRQELVVAARRWEGRRAEVEADMRRLARRLDYKALELEQASEAPRRFVVNPLGEIQSSGLEIDRRCALLEESAEQLERLRRMLGDAGE